MSVGRVSTYNMHQTLLRDSTRTQVDLYNLQGQLSSGQKTDSFSGLGADTEKYIDLDSRLGRSQVYIDSSQIAKDRLTITDNVLSQIIDVATDMKNLIGLRRNSAVGDDLAFQTQLDGKWQSMAQQLNTTYEGRYLFSGASTNAQPVKNTFPVLRVDGEPDTGYYQGSSESLSIRLDDDVTIDYNILGNDEAFQKIVAGFAMAKKFGATTGENTEMQKAYDMIAQGVEGVISLRATVNSNMVTVDDNVERIESLQLYWKGLKEGISNTDIVAVSTQVAVNQGVLQAAFQAFARISSLKLSDFLR